MEEGDPCGSRWPASYHMFTLPLYLTVLEPKELSNPCGGDSHFELAIKALLWVTATTRCSVSMTSYGQFGPQGINSLFLQCLGRLFKWAQWSHGEKNQSGKCNDKCWPTLGITGGDKETEGGCGGWKKVGSFLKGQPPLGSYYWLPCEECEPVFSSSEFSTGAGCVAGHTICTVTPCLCSEGPILALTLCCPGHEFLNNFWRSMPACFLSHWAPQMM